jgi:hypothetical protein
MSDEFPSLGTRAVQPMGCATGDLCGHSQLSVPLTILLFFFVWPINGFGDGAYRSPSAGADDFRPFLSTGPLGS